MADASKATKLPCVASAESGVVLAAVRLSDFADEFDGEISPEYLDALWDAVTNLKRARVRHAGGVQVL